MATVTQAFDGAPDGEIYPKRFNVGDTVTGDLARVAVAEGWAKDEALEVAPPAPKAKRKK